MAIRDEIESTFQRIAVEVRIGGRAVAGVIGVDVSMGLRQINAQADIHLVERPTGADEGVSCVVWAGYNGALAPIFQGEIAGVRWDYFPGAVTVQARDLLARTRLPWGGEDRTYASQDDAAIIQNLLEAMGIPSSATHIESSGWTLGTVQEVVAEAGKPFWPLIEEIDTLAGFRTFTRADGVVWRQRVDIRAAASAAFAYEKGVNIISIRRTRTREGIVNRAIVTGLEYEGLSVGGEGVGEAYADNPYIPDPPRYVTETTQSDLVETDEKALEIATRMVADKNVRVESYELEVLGNPLLVPGMSIDLTHPDVESGAALVRIDHVAHSIRGSSFRTTIQTLGGNIRGGAMGIPPAPAFDVQLFQEGEDTGSGVESRIVVVCDASATIDPDGDERLLTFAWTIAADAGAPSPASGSGVVFRSVVSGGPPTTLTITLVATDPTALSATLERTVAVDSSTLLVEDLYTAEDAVAACSSDGEQTWRTATIPGGAHTTCLMPIAPPWGELWGADDGHLYATFDKLHSALIDLGAPHGAVAATAVWVHEVDPTRAWVGFADGAVYAGAIDRAAQTATWTAAGTIGAGPVHEIRESYGVLGSLRATAGGGYYGSEDGGAHWTLIDSGDTAWRMAGGFDTNLYSFLNDDAPLRAETGSAPTLPTLTPAVRHIRGLAFGWRQKELYAADDLARLFLSDANLSALSLQSDATAAICNHLIRSGNVDRVVYLAIGDGTGDANGFEKWIPETAAPWYIRRTGSRQGAMIGYGPAHHLAARVHFVLVPYGESGDKDQWHRYDVGIWTHGALPQAGWKWISIKINPRNADQWLLLGFPPSGDPGSGNLHGFSFSGGALNDGSGNSPLYYSDDAGASWSAVTLPPGTPTLWPMAITGAQPASIGWAEGSDTWYLVGLQTDEHGFDGYGARWVGATTTGTASAYIGWQQLHWSAPGQAGDVLIVEEDAIGLGTSGGLLSANVADVGTYVPYFHDLSYPGGFTQPFGPVDVRPAPSRAFYIADRSPQGPGLNTWEDYREAIPGFVQDTGALSPKRFTDSVTGAFAWVACGTDDLFVASSVAGQTGFYVCPYTTVAATLAGAPAHPTYAPTYARTGRKRRVVMVGYGQLTSSNYQFAAYDGELWADIPLPIGGMGRLGGPYDTPYDVIEE